MWPKRTVWLQARPEQNQINRPFSTGIVFQAFLYFLSCLLWKKHEFIRKNNELRRNCD
jgi:hypothetical protein